MGPTLAHLVERLVSLIRPAAPPSTAGAADRVDLVNENDAPANARRHRAALSMRTTNGSAPEFTAWLEQSGGVVKKGGAVKGGGAVKKGGVVKKGGAAGARRRCGAE